MCVKCMFKKIAETMVKYFYHWVLGELSPKEIDEIEKQQITDEP